MKNECLWGVDIKLKILMRKVKSLLKETTPFQICSAPFLNSPEWDLFQNRSREKLWSCCSGERMFSVFYQQDLTKALFIICLFMQRVLQVPCNGRPSLLSRLAKKAGSVGNTRLLPHANMPLVPMNCFLCRVDYALEENVLTEQMWILAAY